MDRRRHRHPRLDTQALNKAEPQLHPAQREPTAPDSNANPAKPLQSGVSHVTTLEAVARQTINELLRQAGWMVQDRSGANIGAGPGRGGAGVRSGKVSGHRTTCSL